MDSSLERVFSLIDKYWNSSSDERLLNLEENQIEIKDASNKVPKNKTADNKKLKDAKRKILSPIRKEGAPSTLNYDPDDYISYSPLHNRQPGKMNVTAKRLEELRKDLVVDRGPWASKELKILQRNWDRIVEHHPEFSDPKFAFGDGHDQGGRLSLDAISNFRKKYKKFKIIRRMAFELSDRLICDVYTKCRHMFYNKSFRYSSRKTIPKEIEKAIKNDLKNGVPPYDISYKYDVSPSLVTIIKRHPKRCTTLEKGRFIWTQEALECMKLVVGGLYAESNLLELMARDIKWKSVSKEMRSCGYQVKRGHCRYKWIYTFPKSVVSKYSDEDSKPESRVDISSGSDT